MIYLCEKIRFCVSSNICIQQRVSFVFINLNLTHVYSMNTTAHSQKPVKSSLFRTWNISDAPPKNQSYILRRQK